MINKYKKSNKVYIAGYANAGKSSLINKIMYNYAKTETNIMVSPYPGTTLDLIEVKLDNFNLIDTPGIIASGSIINNINQKYLKKIIPKKEIKPYTYQIKKESIITVDNIMSITLSNNDVTFYMSNDLKIKKTATELNYQERIFAVDNEDIVITGLGFIFASKKGLIKIRINEEINVYKRKRLL
jgi:ribosome biogenesis GTPase A